MTPPMPGVRVRGVAVVENRTQGWRAALYRRRKARDIVAVVDGYKPAEVQSEVSM